MTLQPLDTLVPADLFVMWTTALVFILFKTKSFTSNRTLTTIVLTMFVISIMHRLYGDIGWLYLMMAVITILIWIEIPKYTYQNRRSTDEK